MSDEEFNKKWDVYNMVQKAIETAHTNSAPATIKKFEEIETTLKEIVDILKVLVKTIKDK
jgi:hypothetical protein